MHVLAAEVGSSKEGVTAKGPDGRRVRNATHLTYDQRTVAAPRVNPPDLAIALAGICRALSCLPPERF